MNSLPGIFADLRVIKSSVVQLSKPCVISSNTFSDSQAACLHAGCLARCPTMYRSSSPCIKGCGTLTQMCHPVMETHTIMALQPQLVARTQPALKLPLR